MIARHWTSIEYLPHLGVWLAWCNICGQVSLGQEREDAAWVIADQHRQAQATAP